MKSCLSFAFSCFVVSSIAQAGAKPVASTSVIDVETAGHQQKIKADISGANDLYLVVTDGGDGFSCDWADWISPQLSGPKGTLNLTTLKWKSATCQWGSVRVNRNAGGSGLKVAGKPEANGIGTHANSIIHYEIPEGYSTFTAVGAIDNGGSDQGSTSSVQFAVYTAKPTIATSGSDASREPEDALNGLAVAEGLEATLIAAEPMLLSPSNIDVDHLGRVWVCEVVNYRRFANKNNPDREEGDRILILEDSNGDGQLDHSTTFYQGRDIDSAHGVCVLGNRVIVSAGETVFDFYDDDGDGKADRKEILFRDIKGAQHDHGIHSFTFGPDGRLYFNFGNAGKELHRADGSIVVDQAGNEVRANRKPYQEGMAFRCELDGSNVDTLGWNFRNNWELCVDSFGTVWQSDNDDDGNRGVRINYVMEYGNYGYKDEFTGAGWRDVRTGWEKEIPHRHWHLNDPGVVPNLLQTGAGSPTGILCYEGSLLPEKFQNQLIHCDAGPNVVRSYAVSDHGAGYSAETNNILTGQTDKWFRPSDVCVAPDGSLIIADWYDPGVGGHRQGDVDRGRLFRVAPSGSEYDVPAYELDSIEGAAKALKSPNVATRYLAFQTLRSAGADAEPALAKMFANESNPRFRARALWLLGQIDGRTGHWIQQAAGDDNSNIRITAIRLARRTGSRVTETVKTLVDDNSPQVRRECALALRHLDASEKPALWAKLAKQLPSHDRWYLEALGIAAEGDWDACLAAAKDISEHEVRGSLIWRSRGTESARELTDQIIALAGRAAGSSDSHLPTFFRALDFQPRERVAAQMQRLLKKETLDAVDASHRPVVVAEALARLGTNDLSSDPAAKTALNEVLESLAGTAQFVQLVERFRLVDRYDDLLAMAQSHPNEQLGIDAVVSLVRTKQWKVLSNGLNNDDSKVGVATALAMANTRQSAVTGPLLAVVKNADAAIDVRREAVRAASVVRNLANELINLYESKQLDSQLHQTLAAALHRSTSRGTQEIADRLFPLPPSKEGKPLPPISQLVTRKGDIANGRLVFNTTGTCHKCHVIDKIGREIGPDLSEIGSKLSRQAMFESIIYPSAGISHNYEAYTLVMANGTTATGLIMSETDDVISLKSDDGIVRTYPTDEIDDKVKQKISLMPADLQKVMTAQEMVDVVEYLLTLKKKSL